jgi:RNA polymerase sigma factor (sigma-70 family)
MLVQRLNNLSAAAAHASRRNPMPAITGGAVVATRRTTALSDGTDPTSSALERLLQRYAAILWRTVRQRGLPEAEIDDLFQEVRIRLWRALSSAEQIAQAPASYLYRTASSAALDLIRRRRARREESIHQGHEGLAVASSTYADQAVEASELADRIAHAVASLSESRRVVVRMYLAGYHRREIAELLGWTEAKTRNLLYRGLADLRARLTTATSQTA